MNICLNTLRLTTVSLPDEITEDETSVSIDELQGSSPDGVLHNAKPLPYIERLAIAHHTCTPSRVEQLVSPIFTKLAERWNLLEEQIREIDSNKLSANSQGFASFGEAKSAARAKEKSRLEKMIGNFREKASNIQDELLILEDVLKVCVLTALTRYFQPINALLLLTILVKYVIFRSALRC